MEKKKRKKEEICIGNRFCRLHATKMMHIPAASKAPAPNSGDVLLKMPKRIGPKETQDRDPNASPQPTIHPCK
jgi:hypothetical protein